MLRAAVVGVMGLLLMSADVPTGSYRLPFPAQVYDGLSGNFGEVRPGHWHYGLDFRVGPNTPIYAVADGYVARVRVSSGGYGKSVYIRHLHDGHTTVYGHLARFSPRIELRIEALQRESQQFEQEWFPEPGEIVVQAGDLVAYSGNTGYSTGPHLHYEVRDTQEYVLNPLAYHRGVIPDTKPPYLVKLALEPLSAQSRVDGLFEKLVFTPAGTGPTYTTVETHRVEGPVGLEFAAYDQVGGSTNANGVYRTELRLDGALIWEQRMDRFGFHHSPSINQHIDFGYYQRHRQVLQKAYADSGNRTPVYPTVVKGGVIELLDNLPHRLELSLTDYHGNRSTWRTTLQRGTSRQRVPTLATDGPGLAPSYSVRRNVLILKSGLPRVLPDTAKLRVVFATGADTLLRPAYTSAGWAYTLLPLDDGRLPVRAEAPFWPNPLFFNYLAHASPTQPTTAWLNDRFWVDVPYGSLFLPMPLAVRAYNVAQEPRVLSPVYSVGEPNVALQGPLQLNFRFTPTEASIKYRAEQIVVARRYGYNSYERVEGDYRMGRLYRAPSRSFGDFCLVADPDPPELKARNLATGQTRVVGSALDFTLRDGLAGIRTDRIRVSWDGAWLPYEYHAYRSHLTCSVPPGSGSHTLRVEAEDMAGNRAVATFTLRVP